MMIVIAIAALFVGALIQVVLALAGYWSGRRGSPVAAGAASPEHLEELSDKLIALEARLQVVQAQLSQLGVRQQALDLRSTGGAEGKSYEVAAHLVRKGTRLDEIIKTCGISRGEAELIGRLYEADLEVHGQRESGAAFGGRVPAAAVPTIQPPAPPARAGRARRGGNINQVVE